MSLRQKLLLLVSLTVAAAVVAVSWTVLVRIQRVFDQRDQQDTALVISQFQREFQHRSAEVTAAVDRLAASEHVRAMAFEIVQSGDSAPYLTEAQTLAQQAQLDFLEIVGPDGNVVSSAQWPARFGYPEPAASAIRPGRLSQAGRTSRRQHGAGTVRRSCQCTAPSPRSGWSAGGVLTRASSPTFPSLPACRCFCTATLGRRRVRARFQPSSNASPFSIPGTSLARTAKSPPRRSTDRSSRSAIKAGQQTSAILYLSGQREDSVNATAIPLKNESGAVLAVLTVALSRTGLVAAQQHIRAIAYGVATAGILLAIVISLWIAARVSRPIEELARAAQDVADGNWDTQVPERGRDELSVLAQSFNHMTSQLSSQRDRLVQTERVAAWRELARRLAHELKNPLFPLQLTVENLVRARELPAEEFDEVFRESTQTLGMEIANLKTIIGRFSDFSKMPKPELERIDAKDVSSGCDRSTLHGLTERACDAIHGQVAGRPMPLDADPELLHRALSNLVLNAIDAMPDGGTLTLSRHAAAETRWRFASPTPARASRPKSASACSRPTTPPSSTAPAWGWPSCSR